MAIDGYMPAPLSIPVLGGIGMEVIEEPAGEVITENKESQKPRIIVEVMPEFEGGTEALMAYIEKHLKYPRWEKKNKIEGTVYATFVIDEKGNIGSPEILKSVQGSRNFDDEVLKLLKKMPKWKPGMEKGVKTAVQFNLPFRFKL